VKPVLSASKPRWQQVTALVSLGASGTVTGFSFVPASPADLMSPTSMPVRLMALEQSVKPAPSSDGALRSAIVNVANYYLQMAQGKTPAEMEAIIWQHDSIGGADHGESCAAFASLTLELAAQVVGQQSWVTGGTSYPWPIHKWADVRVDPNPASLDIVSILQDAQAHGRWHPLGDGYQPQPGDWVLFDGHVEVVTKYADGVLHTIGGDSLPNFSVNAHTYPGPLAEQGIAGFVNNGDLPAASAVAPGNAKAAAPLKPKAAAPASAGHSAPSSPEHLASDSQGAAQATRALPTIPGTPAADSPAPGPTRQAASAAIPGTAAPAPSRGPGAQAPRQPGRAPRTTPVASHQAGRGAADADVPGTASLGAARTPSAASAGTPAIPGLPAAPQHQSGTAAPYQRHRPPAVAAPAAGVSAQQAFIDQVAPGAMATQRRYGVPAAVTIAQAIDESGWGQSVLAAQDNNLFGIKGIGPAGSASLPTEEYENGQWVSTTAPFRVYQNFAQSINDHGKLLATSGYYTQAMAERSDPDSFAQALTGVYATNPDYGTDLIQLMQQYDLYRYDVPAPADVPHSPARPARPARGVQRTAAPARPSPKGPAPAPAASRSPGSARPTPSPRPARSPRPASSPAPAPRPTPTRTPRPNPGPASTPRPTISARLVSEERPIGPAPVSRAQRAADADAYRPFPAGMSSTLTFSARPMPAPAERQPRTAPAPGPHTAAKPYHHHLPASVKNDLVALAKAPLLHAEMLYRDIASSAGISWQLLAACDWMQCEARPRHSPVHGEKLGTPNPDGTVYRTKSEALEQCARELAELAGAVYGIDLAAAAGLSLRDLARVFAAFRWGGLLKQHHTSAMEFPYSVAGLTVQHLNMRWPNIGVRNTPDKPGARFRGPFGAVPVMLFLNYPATD